MKRIAFISFLFLILYQAGFSQTTFWTEAFENGCASGCLASAYVGPNGAWTVTTTGANGICPNQFYISCAENGGVAGSCGTGCGTDEALHIANQACSPWAPSFCPTGDCGAAYDAGAACGGFCCGFGLCVCGSVGANVISNRTARSPVINATGYTAVSVSFVYMENGQAALDNADFEYFDGAVWTTVALAKTPAGGCAPQGQWTAFTFNFPASINNNPNLRVGFRWTNNGDGAGADPSFAVDDVVISGTVALPVDLISFDANCENGLVKLDWLTASEENNSHFVIEKSIDAVSWKEIGRVGGNGNSNIIRQYSFQDNDISPIAYYRLKQVDINGNFKYYNPISVTCQNTATEINIHPNPSSGIFNISAADGILINSINIMNIQGQSILPSKYFGANGTDQTTMDLSALNAGIYFLKIQVGNSWITKQVVITK